MALAVRKVWAGLLLALLAFGCQLVAGDFTIEDPSTGAGAECKHGDYRCNGEYLLTCGASGWVTKQACGSANLCNSKAKQCEACKPGDQRCDGQSRQECKADSSGWREVESCSSAAMCNPTYCGACTPGEFACRGMRSNVGAELWECGPDGGWSIPHGECASAGLCDASLEAGRTNPSWDKTCLTPLCDAGAYTCNDNKLEHCRPDQTGWDDVDTCDSKALCQVALDLAAKNAGTIDMCPPGCGTAGAFVCEGTTLKQCKDDLTDWDVVQACPAATECNPVAGACTDLCTPGEYQCNGAVLRQCQPDRHWRNETTCASSALCQTTTDPAPSGSCTPPACDKAGDFACSGADLQRCRDDLTGYDPVESCSSSDLCSAADKRCNDPVCDPSEYKCFGSELRQCNAGLTDWTLISTCQDNQFCSNDPLDPGCKMECPSAARCNGNELQTCTANGWVHKATCATNDLCSCGLNGNCELGSDADGCGKPVCGGSLATYQCVDAKLQKCDAGRDAWLDDATCGSAALCYPGSSPSYQNGYCAVCPTAGELACSYTNPNVVQQCAADRKTWTLQATCGSFGCIENGTNDYCAGCGPVGKVQCSGATLQRCDNGQKAWSNTTCTSAALCDAAHNQCDVCPAGQVSCMAKTLQQCSSDGQKLTNTICVTLCDAAGAQCDICMPGTARCSGTHLYKCSNDGQTESDTTCTSAAFCNAGALKCDVCGKDDRICDAEQPQKCNADRSGYMDDGAACVSAPLCVNGTCQSPVCPANMVDCNGTTLRKCNATSSAWVTQDTCDTAELCDEMGDKCNDPFCASTAHHCTSAGVLQQCNAGRTAWEDVMPCGSAALCDETAGKCLAMTCTPGDYNCSTNVLQKCKSDGSGWDTVATCTAPTPICDKAGKECDACVAPQYACSNNMLTVCDSTGHFGPPTDCSPGTCNATTGMCDASAGGAGG
ncbi:MAG TPA: hypothetical protein VGQ57_05300, partial [Polyangiaceae bacterium]|nr:hypothetical protein [Polyangiaceae bacterium]